MLEKEIRQLQNHILQFKSIESDKNLQFFLNSLLSNSLVIRHGQNGWPPTLAQAKVPGLYTTDFSGKD